MKKICLNRDQIAIVDDWDYERLNQWKWTIGKWGNNFYAVRSIKNGNRRRIIRMHRVVLNLKYGDRIQVDHIDGNGLNNQRSNLRICTTQENQFNRKPNKIASSPYKGVSWNRSLKKWEAKIQHNKKAYHLGLFDCEIEAAEAYDMAAKRLFGGFAKLNFNIGTSI